MHLPKLKELRLSKGVSQKDIASYLRIAQTVYSRYERGAQTIPLHHLIKLADLYEESLDYIVGRNPKLYSADNSYISSEL